MESRNFNLHKLFKATSNLGKKIKGISKREILNKFNLKSIQAVKKEFNISNNENAYRALTEAYIKIQNEHNRIKTLNTKIHRELNVRKQPKAQKTISSALAKTFRQSKTVIPLEDTVGSVVRKLGLKKKNKPFEITIHSWKVGNVKKTYKFNSLEHYKNWLEKVLNSGEVEDYEYKRKYHYGQPELLDLFRFARIGNVQIVSCGCNRDSRCLEKTLKSSHYEFAVYNPISRSNNCFFKCLEKIIGSSVDTKQLRKEFQIPTDTPVDITQAYKII